MVTSISLVAVVALGVEELKVRLAMDFCEFKIYYENQTKKI